MQYSVYVLPSAEREMARLPREYFNRLRLRIGRLAEEPRPHGAQKLQGSKDEYRIRQGPYRILYRVDDRMRRVVIYSVAHRKDAYK